MNRSSAPRVVRFGALVTLTSALLVLPTAASADGGPWTQFQGTTQHTGRATTSGPLSAVLAWTSSAPDDVEAGVAIAPDGTIFTVATDGFLQALAPDGSQKWNAGIATRVYASPVLGQDGKVLIGDIRGRFRAYAPDTGSGAWSLTGYGSIRGTAAVGADGSIYFGTDNGTLVSLDMSGKERFRVRATSGKPITAAPAIAPNGDLFWAAQDGQLKRMAPSGNVLWDVTVPGPIVSAPSIGADGTVYAGAGGSIIAVDPNSGAIKWQVGAGADVATTPAIAPDGTIVAGADNGMLNAIAPDGTTRWQYQTGAPVRSSAAIGADGTIYFGSDDSNFYILDSNGKLLSTYHALQAVRGPAAITPDGLALVGSTDNHLYAIKDSAKSYTQSPADRLGGDLARDPATGKVYVFVNGRRRFIPDPATQTILGLNTGALPKTLTGSELVRYPEGPALPALAEGSVVQESNGPIYVIQNGQRVWIPTLDAFAAGGYRWESVVQLEDLVIRSIPLTVKDGMLIKGSGDKVYLVQGGQRHWITTANALASRGYNWSQVQYVSDAIVSAVPEGDPLT